MKKKVNQTDINTMNSKLAYKIFDLLIIDNDKFYIDRKMNLIWDKNKDVAGIIDNDNKTYFFDDLSFIKDIQNIQEV
jgi:hypothetical protein